MSGVHFGGARPHDHGPRPGAAVVRSPLARWPADLRLALALAVVVITAVVPPQWWPWHATVAVLLLAAVVWGRLPVRPLVVRLAWLAPFVAGAALAAAWHGPAGPGWRVVALRGGLCLATMLVFGASTPFAALPAVLRRWRVPALFVTTLALLHRYLFVLTDEAERMRRARLSRTLAPTRRPEWAGTAALVGRLFVRASERAERIYLAMCARGWR